MASSINGVAINGGVLTDVTLVNASGTLDGNAASATSAESANTANYASTAGSATTATTANTATNAVNATNADYATAAGSAATSVTASSAGQLTNNLTITATGVATGSVSFDGSEGSVTLPLSSPVVNSNPGTHLKTTADQYGRVTNAGSASLSDLTAPTSNFSLDGYKIVDGGMPILPGDYATKGYVDSVASSFPAKDLARVATTENITLSGLQIIDGYQLEENERVLVWQNTNFAENGIYDAHVGSWTRSLDASTWDELVGASIGVSAGTTYSGVPFLCTIDSGGTLGVDAVVFVTQKASVNILAGGGIAITGTALSPIISTTTQLLNFNSTTGNGLVTLDSYGNSVTRQIVSTSPNLSVSNGAGGEGNPTLSWSASLNDLSPPNTNYSLNGKRLTNAQNPVDAQDYVTLNYLNSYPIVNIYTSDGTLTNNRTITVGNKTLNIYGTSGSVLDMGIDSIFFSGNYTALSSGVTEFAGATIKFTNVPFAGGGIKYLSVTNTGTLTPSSLPGASGTLLYNNASVIGAIAHSTGVLSNNASGTPPTWTMSPTLTSAAFIGSTNQIVLGNTVNTHTITTSATITAPRTCTLPDANTTTVVPTTVSAGQFVEAITANGVQSKRAITNSDLPSSVTFTNITCTNQLIGNAGAGNSYILSSSTGTGSFQDVYANNLTTSSTYIPVNGFVIFLGPYTRRHIINPASNLSSGTFNIPAPLYGQGYEFSIRTTRDINGLTFNALGGNTISNVPNTIKAGKEASFVYSGTTWYVVS